MASATWAWRPGAIAVDVAEQPAHLAHGVGQVGSGALRGDVGVAGIEPDQFLALAHQVAVVGADADHGADDLRVICTTLPLM